MGVQRFLWKGAAEPLAGEHSVRLDAGESYAYG